MKLAVFGDSFVQGFYEGRNDRGAVVEKYNKFNLCHYLGEELGIHVSNEGLRSSSNQCISNTFIRWVSSYMGDSSEWMVLFVWSECGRDTDINPKYRDYKDNKDLYELKDYILGHIDPRGNADVWQNPAIKRMQFEQSIHSCRMLCEDYGIPYLMTSSITNEYFMNMLLNGDRQTLNGNLKVDKLKFQFGRAKENWIEPHKPNNTMLDIITDNWLNDKKKDNVSEIKSVRRNLDSRMGLYKNTLTRCLHPTKEGHKLIAKTLAPYIKKKLEE